MSSLPPSILTELCVCPQAPVNGDTPTAEDLSENDSGVELTNENSPLTAAEPPSPFSPKQNGDAASPQGWCDARTTSPMFVETARRDIMWLKTDVMSCLLNRFESRCIHEAAGKK